MLYPGSVVRLAMFKRVFPQSVHSFVTLSDSLTSCCIVSVLHQEEGGIGKSIPDAQDFPRPERFPEGEARGKSRGSREILRDFPRPWVLHPETRGSRGAKPMAKGNLEGGGDGFSNPSRVLVEHGHSLIITREGPHWFSSLFNENQWKPTTTN